MLPVHFSLGPLEEHRRCFFRDEWWEIWIKSSCARGGLNVRAEVQTHVKVCERTSGEQSRGSFFNRCLKLSKKGGKLGGKTDIWEVDFPSWWLWYGWWHCMMMIMIHLYSSLLSCGFVKHNCRKHDKIENPTRLVKLHITFIIICVYSLTKLCFIYAALDSRAYRWYFKKVLPMRG